MGSCCSTSATLPRPQTDQPAVGKPRSQAKPQALCLATPEPDPSQPRLFLQQVEENHRRFPDKVVYTWLDSKEREARVVSFRELWNVSGQIADALTGEHQLAPGERVMVVYPFGIEFIFGFIGALRAGLIVVSVYPPRPNQLKRDALIFNKFVENSGAKFALTTRGYGVALKGMNFVGSKSLRSAVTWIYTDAVLDVFRSFKRSLSQQLSPVKQPRSPPGTPTSPGSPSTPTSIRKKFLHKVRTRRFEEPPINPEDVAFLQYTSGSTGEPKGVMISHFAVTHNIHSLCSLSYDSMDENSTCVSWLPQYHDYGLVVAFLSAAYRAFHLVAFSPLDFIRNPLMWARAIDKYGASATAGPNFSYGLIARRIKALATRRGCAPSQVFNLSSVNDVNIAAEPINPQVLQAMISIGFRPEAIDQTYGCAEQVVHVCSGGRGTVRGFASCGDLRRGEEFGKRVVIVDDDLQPVPDGKEGHVVVSTPSAALGYWGNEELTKERFFNKLDGSDKNWYRTGDVGFVQDGQLYITSRSSDLIVVHGRNFYPTDLEECVQHEFDKEVRPGSVVAVQISEDAVGIMADLSPEATFSTPESCARIAEEVTRQCEVRVNKVALLQKGGVPKTTSGKVRRRYVASLLMETEELPPSMKVVCSWTRQSDDRNDGEVANIGIIGAGPSGLAAALELVSLGYTNITVFERDSVCGGRSLGYNGMNELYACSHVYAAITALAQEVGVNTRGMPKVDSATSQEPLTMPSSTSTDLQTPNPVDRTQPASVWARTGYGLVHADLHDTPYFQLFCSFSETVTRDERTHQEVSSIQASFYPPGFLQTLWREAHKFLEGHGVKFQMERQVSKLEGTRVSHCASQGGDAERDEEFDAVIIATLPTEARNFVSTSDDGYDLLRKVKLHEYGYVRFQASLPGTNHEYIFDQNYHGSDKLGLPLSFNIYDGHRSEGTHEWLALVYRKLADNPSVASDEYIANCIRSQVEELQGEFGAVLDSKFHVFFPHVDQETIDSGFFAQWEHLQGRHGLFWVSSFLGFELTETAVRYARATMRQHFPNISTLVDPEGPRTDDGYWVRKYVTELFPMFPTGVTHVLPRYFSFASNPSKVYRNNLPMLDFTGTVGLDPAPEVPTELLVGMWEPSKRTAGPLKFRARVTQIDREVSGDQRLAINFLIDNAQGLPMVRPWSNTTEFALGFYTNERRYPIHGKDAYAIFKARMFGEEPEDVVEKHARWTRNNGTFFKKLRHCFAAECSSSGVFYTFQSDTLIYHYWIVPEVPPAWDSVELPPQTCFENTAELLAEHGIKLKIMVQFRPKEGFEAVLPDGTLHVGRLNDSLPWDREKFPLVRLGCFDVPAQSDARLDDKSPFFCAYGHTARLPASYSLPENIKGYHDEIIPLTAVEFEERVKADDTLSTLKSVVQLLFQQCTHELGEDESLEGVGMTSFQAVQIASFIESSFDVTFPVSLVYTCDTLRGITKVLEQGVDLMHDALLDVCIDAALPDSPGVGQPFDIEFQRVIEDPPPVRDNTPVAEDEQFDVIVVGAGVAGLHVATEVQKSSRSVLVLEKAQRPGGVWESYGNAHSRLNSSEPAYRIDLSDASNINHTPKQGIVHAATTAANNLLVLYSTEVTSVSESAVDDVCAVTSSSAEHGVRVFKARRVVLCIARQLGQARKHIYPGESDFKGVIVDGMGAGLDRLDVKGKRLCVIGMGASAVETVRFALEHGAVGVDMVVRSYANVHPRFAEFGRNHLDFNELNTRARTLSAVTLEVQNKLAKACQMANWDNHRSTHTNPIPTNCLFVANYYGFSRQILGEVVSVDASGVVVKRTTTEPGQDDQAHVAADIIVKCLGFENSHQVETMMNHDTDLLMDPLGFLTPRVHYLAEYLFHNYSFDKTAATLRFFHIFNGNYLAVIRLLTAIWLHCTFADLDPEWDKFTAGWRRFAPSSVTYESLAICFHDAELLFPWVRDLLREFVETKVVTFKRDLPQHRFLKQDLLAWRLLNNLAARSAPQTHQGLPPLPYFQRGSFRGTGVQPLNSWATAREEATGGEESGGDERLRQIVWFIHGAGSDPSVFSSTAQSHPHPVLGVDWHALLHPDPAHRKRWAPAFTLEWVAGEIVAMITDRLPPTCCDIVLVGHSMGGVIARLVCQGLIAHLDHLASEVRSRLRIQLAMLEPHDHFRVKIEVAQNISLPDRVVDSVRWVAEGVELSTKVRELLERDLALLHYHLDASTAPNVAAEGVRAVTVVSEITQRELEDKKCAASVDIEHIDPDIKVIPVSDVSHNDLVRVPIELFLRPSIQQ